MTDAQLQPLYDIIRAVFKAGERFAVNPSHISATALIPLVQQAEAYVEARVHAERQARCAACAACEDAAIEDGAQDTPRSSAPPSGSAA